VIAGLPTAGLRQQLHTYRHTRAAALWNSSGDPIPPGD
jgi:hypothetical protein